ncbi:MAG: flavodoxin family protein [Desulfococcaceae bacterium]
MKTVLGIIASPRRLGNCELMVKEIARSIPEPHDLRLLRLHDFAIGSCRACYACLFGDGVCPVGDDLPAAIEAIAGADALIVAAPTYYLGPNAALKDFLDRGLSFYAHADRLWGTPAVGVSVAGIPGREGYAKLGIQSFLKLLLADVKGVEVAYGALPGEVFLSDENREMAAALGKALFGEPVSAAGPVCPLCGGDTFRFLGGDQVRCMLCSNAGRMETGPEGPSFQIERGEHQLFLTRKDVEDHGEWLRSMKDRFMERRKELKRLILPYRKDGEWIRPDGAA